MKKKEMEKRIKELERRVRQVERRDCVSPWRIAPPCPYKCPRVGYYDWTWRPNTTNESFSASGKGSEQAFTYQETGWYQYDPVTDMATKTS